MWARNDNHPELGDRARWLADLAAALDQAHRLVGRMLAHDPGSREAAVLRTRIRATQVEIDTLQRGLPSRSNEIGPLSTRSRGYSPRDRSPDPGSR